MLALQLAHVGPVCPVCNFGTCALCALEVSKAITSGGVQMLTICRECTYLLHNLMTFDHGHMNQFPMPCLFFHCLFASALKQQVYLGIPSLSLPVARESFGQRRCPVPPLLIIIVGVVVAE